MEISIHALREEGDGAGFQGIEATIQFLSTPSARRATLAGSRTTSSPIRFLSTPSARRATARRRVREGFRWISIHALREEGDSSPEGERGIPLDFYPRPPRGGRLNIPAGAYQNGEFLSTPSARRATASSALRSLRTTRFLSTPSARRATRPQRTYHINPENFYPRPPRGGRPEIQRKERSC